MHWNSIKRLLKYWYMTYDGNNSNKNLRHLVIWKLLSYDNLGMERKVNKCYPTTCAIIGILTKCYGKNHMGTWFWDVGKHVTMGNE